ncbi:UDP-N-acetylmuramoyl-L-alanine--D-glutamate ligase [Bacteroidota bacterium]
MKRLVVILGAGESGTGAAVLAKKQDYKVFVSDSNQISNKYKDLLEKYNIECEESGHTEDKILKADEIIKSPGIPDNAEMIIKAKNLLIPIISEIEFASRYSNAYKICITGSNGKTTTTMLTYEILKRAGLNVGLSGNVGNSFAFQVAENDFDYYVMELSSFQLDGMYDFKADTSILLNITPDHLDRYDNDFQKYINSKFRITQNQTDKDVFIYCCDDQTINQNLDKIQGNPIKYPFSIKKKLETGGFIDSVKNLTIKTTNTLYTMAIEDLILKGRHNIYNSMAAGIASNVLSIRKETIRECLTDFQGVEHRLEHVLKVHGIEFINDSKATNVNSTWYALETINTPIVWIAGGIDKGNDYKELIPLVKQKVKGLICLGKDNTKLLKTFENVVETITEAFTMKEAVKAAYFLAKKGETVLLSPACASFDLFENYEDRGWQFKRSVREL